MSEQVKSRPDAVKFPSNWKEGNRPSEGFMSLVLIAEKLLECDYPREKAYVHLNPGGSAFCTRDDRDTLFFPTTHTREGQSRYNWESHPDGYELGYLVEGAAETVTFQVSIGALQAMRQPKPEYLKGVLRRKRTS